MTAPSHTHRYTHSKVKDFRHIIQSGKHLTSSILTVAICCWYVHIHARALLQERTTAATFVNCHLLVFGYNFLLPPIIMGLLLFFILQLLLLFCIYNYTKFYVVL